MWLVFTLVTTLLWGIAELFYKKGSHEDKKYDHLRVCILVGAVMGIHAIFTLLTSDIAYNPMNLVAYLPVSLCYILSMACSFFGIRFIEESLADPIENTAGAMCDFFRRKNCTWSLGWDCNNCNRYYRRNPNGTQCGCK